MPTAAADCVAPAVASAGVECPAAAVAVVAAAAAAGQAGLAVAHRFEVRDVAGFWLLLPETSAELVLGELWLLEPAAFAMLEQVSG